MPDNNDPKHRGHEADKAANKKFGGTTPGGRDRDDGNDLRGAGTEKDKEEGGFPPATAPQLGAGRNPNVNGVEPSRSKDDIRRPGDGRRSGERRSGQLDQR